VYMYVVCMLLWIAWHGVGWDRHLDRHVRVDKAWWETALESNVSILIVISQRTGVNVSSEALRPETDSNPETPIHDIEHPSVHRLLARVDALDANELRLEDESRVGLDDGTHSAVAVGEVGGDGQLALFVQLHAEESLIPALDDLASTDGEVERVATLVAGIELGAVQERALVVHIDRVVAGGLAGALALGQHLDLKTFKLGDGHLC
jgi:hypothetical protein